MHSNLTAADVAKYFGAKLVDAYGRVYSNYCIYNTGEIKVVVSKVPNTTFYSNQEWYLLLKPLSEISEDDAVEVALMCGCHYQLRGSLIKAGKELATEYRYKQSNLTGKDWQNSIDYLRSKGYDMDNYLTTNKAKHG
jgi:hypothetical protein